MPRELIKDKQERALRIAERMNERYPAAECALHYWGDPFKLTIAVLLSAQTTDKGVNKVRRRCGRATPRPKRLRKQTSRMSKASSAPSVSFMRKPQTASNAHAWW